MERHFFVVFGRKSSKEQRKVSFHEKRVELASKTEIIRENAKEREEPENGK